MDYIAQAVDKLLVKYNLSSNSVLRVRFGKSPGIVAGDFFMAILVSATLEECGNLLGYSVRTPHRILLELNNGATFSEKGGSIRQYLLVSVGFYFCKSCSQILPTEDFHKNETSSSTGLKPKCKNCSSIEYKNYYKNNTATVKNSVALYRAQKIKATPKWANLDLIKEIYDNAEGCHVDHIVPLNHPLVCGLHVEYNLQYLTPLENLQKGNKFIPG